VLAFAGEHYCRYSPRQGEEGWPAIRSVGGLEMAVVFTLRGERNHPDHQRKKGKTP
jgi:hypothetical protein